MANATRVGVGSTPKITYTPEDFGAIGDGVADDSVSLKNMFDAVKATATSSSRVDAVLTRTYLITTGNLQGSSYADYYGGGTIITNSTDDQLKMLIFTDCTEFSISHLNITRSSFPNPALLWSKGAMGVQIFNGTKFSVRHCDISYHTDALSVSSGSQYAIEYNRVHELGEEGISLRRSNRFSCSYNDVYHHHGDGILLKNGEVQCYNGTINYNRLFDGYKDSVAAVGQRGGGITLNDEVIGGISNMTFDSLTIEGNQCRNLSYGISLANVSDLRILGNHCQTIERFAINLDTTVFNNPSRLPLDRSIISNNTVKDCAQFGIGAVTNNSIEIRYVTISGNVVENAGSQTTADYPAISANGCVVTGNYVYNSRVACLLTNCVSTGNTFELSSRTTDGVSAAWVRLSGSGIFSNNIIKDTNRGFIRMSGLRGMVFTGNQVELASGYAGIYFLNEFFDNNVFGLNSFLVPSYPDVSRFEVGSDSIRRIGLSATEFGHRVRTYDGVGSSNVNVVNRVGDQYLNQLPVAGRSHGTIVTAVDGSNVPSLAPLGFTYRKVSTTADINVINGQTQTVKVTGLTGVLSTWMTMGAALSVAAQGLSVYASVTNAAEVTFLIVNRSGNDRVIPSVTFNAYVHEVI